MFWKFRCKIIKIIAPKIQERSYSDVNWGKESEVMRTALG